MNFTSIVINDLSNPIEVKAWIVDNPTVTIQSIQIVESRAFILYQ